MNQADEFFFSPAAFLLIIEDMVILCSLLYYVTSYGLPYYINNIILLSKLSMGPYLHLLSVTIRYMYKMLPSNVCLFPLPNFNKINFRDYANDVSFLFDLSSPQNSAKHRYQSPINSLQCVSKHLALWRFFVSFVSGKHPPPQLFPYFLLIVLYFDLKYKKSLK